MASSMHGMAYVERTGPGLQAIFPEGSGIVEVTREYANGESYSVTAWGDAATNPSALDKAFEGILEERDRYEAWRLRVNGRIDGNR